MLARVRLYQRCRGIVIVDFERWRGWLWVGMVWEWVLASRKSYSVFRSIILSGSVLADMVAGLRGRMGQQEWG